MAPVRITRPAEGATPQEVMDYYGAVTEALDAAGVAKGEDFYVVSADKVHESREPAPEQQSLGDPAPQPALYDVAGVGANHLGAFEGDSDTSRKAALDNYPRSGSQRERVLLEVVAAGDRGAISDEITAKTGIYIYSVRPRMVELREGGWIEPKGDGVTRTGKMGSQVEVFVATAKGRRESRGAQAQAA